MSVPYRGDQRADAERMAATSADPEALRRIVAQGREMYRTVGSRNPRADVICEYWLQFGPMLLSALEERALSPQQVVFGGPCPQCGYEERANTDRILWRDQHEHGDFYADSVSVTEGGGIAMQSGGLVIVLPVKEWMRAASHVPPPAGQVDERAREMVQELNDCAKWFADEQNGAVKPEHTTYGKAAALLESTAARLAAAQQREAEDIIACIQSTTWGGWHEIVEMIRRRIASRAGTGEQK